MATNKKAHPWNKYLDKPNALFFLHFMKDYPVSYRNVMDRAIEWIQSYHYIYSVGNKYFEKLALAMTQDATDLEKCVNKEWLNPENIIRIFTNMIKTIGAVYANTNQLQFKLNVLEHEAVDETHAVATDDGDADRDLKVATLTKVISETKKKHEVLVQYISVDIWYREFTDDYSLGSESETHVAIEATESLDAAEAEESF